MPIIYENLDFSKEWTDSDDFPTRESSESQVREDIQLLFDELKNYINNVIVVAINNQESRIASLGGGGSVGHDIIADNAIEANNIKDGEVTPSKIEDYSLTMDKFDDDVSEFITDTAEASVADLFNGESQYADDLTDLIKTTVRNMTIEEWGVQW